MDGALLHVLHCTLDSGVQIEDVLRMVRQACPRDGGHSVLLLCDLSQADAAILPGDAPMLRRLQSGVMTMNARSSGEILLLVRGRVWDDASRAYLGQERACSVRETAAQMLTYGETDAAFASATVSPASLKGRFSFVLFSELALACTPDTPRRMAEALCQSGCSCICARVLEKRSFPQTALSRLCAGSPFSLSALRCVQEDRLRRQGRYSPDAPTAYTAAALADSLAAPISSAPVAEDCFFIRRNSAALPDFFAQHRLLCLRGSILPALFPILQLILLFLSALTGLPLLTALALLPGGVWALLRPRLLPGALLRLSLLPLTTCVSLDALLCRMLARSKRLRLRVPDALVTPQGCALFGAVLLPAALVSAQALVYLLPISLLWLAAPLIMPALDAPTLERIPLGSDQIEQLLSLSKSAFFDSVLTACSPSIRMLSACAGCMLGLLEPDEAARQVQSQLELPAPPQLSAADCAAQLAAAQYLRERMGDCDAALRDLPACLEAHALALPLERSSGRLSVLLAAARQEMQTPQTLERLARCETPEPADLLFLPMESARHTPVYPVSLPLTHPHTFLKRQLLAPDTAVRPADAALRFLFLAAAALHHPFYALLERSPVAGPYMPLFSM